MCVCMYMQSVDNILTAHKIKIAHKNYEIHINLVNLCAENCAMPHAL